MRVVEMERGISSWRTQLKLMQWCFILVLMFTFLTAVEGRGSTIKAAVSGNLMKDLWSGNYSVRSDLCTDPRSGKSCSEDFHDDLNIVFDGQSYLVELNSTQAYQHVCFFSFRMKDIGGALVYKTNFGDLLINKDKGALKISSNGINPTALGLEICGAHADINGLKFPLGSRLNLE